MVDSLAMFFGAKKRRSPMRKRKSPVRKSSSAMVVVNGKNRKLHKGKNGGLYYKTKSGKAYVDAKFVRLHSVRKGRSPMRSRASPKRRRASPKRRRASPKRRRASPTRYGYGLGQPSLMDMMGPAGLEVVQRHHMVGPGGSHPEPRYV